MYSRRAAVESIPFVIVTVTSTPTVTTVKNGQVGFRYIILRATLQVELDAAATFLSSDIGLMELTGLASTVKRFREVVAAGSDFTVQYEGPIVGGVGQAATITTTTDSVGNSIVRGSLDIIRIPAKYTISAP